MEDFLQFLHASPTPYHASANLMALLKQHGFEELRPDRIWDTRPGGRYVVRWQNTTLSAWTMPVGDGGLKAPADVRVVSTHLDFCNLRVRDCDDPHLRLQTYGGGMWPSWLDRTLTVAGQVYVKGTPRAFHLKDTPCLAIPNLAVHLADRKKGEKYLPELDPEKHLVPYWLDPTSDQDQKDEQKEEEKNKTPSGMQRLQREICQREGWSEEDCTGWDIHLTGVEPPMPLWNGLVASPRLDDLCLSYFAVRAMCDTAPGAALNVVGCYDHEEIGSNSDRGARTHGSGVVEVVRRIGEQHPGLTRQDAWKHRPGSVLVSADVHHGYHPGHPDRYGDQDRVALGGGIAVFRNSHANQSHTPHSLQILESTAKKAGIGKKVRHFYVTNAHSCGATLGPYLAANLGLPTLEIGVPVLGMHSIRELVAWADLDTFYKYVRAQWA